MMRLDENQEMSYLTKKFLNLIEKAANFVIICNERVEKIHGKIPEYFAAACYGILHLVLAVFHEPWCDEGTAWQIARCASVKELLLEVPHYEGHPPLWHLVLSLFAKSGMPYELSLTVVSLFFTGTAVILILKYAPFPRLLKLLLPFTYFLFYQYSVLSRPYCMMFLAFVLLAVNYSKRNEKPGRYVLLLLFLSLTSAYGIVIAGGIAFCWLLELWDKRKLTDFLKNFRKDKRIWWLFFLLVCALILIIEIIPREDTVATSHLVNYEKTTGIIKRLLYGLFGMIGDVFITNNFGAYAYGALCDIAMGWGELSCSILIGMILLIGIVYTAWKTRSTALVLIPYGMFTIFSSVVYIYPHHMGIILFIVLFWFWTIMEPGDLWERLQTKVSLPNFRIIRSALILLLSAAIIVPLYWSVSASVADVCTNYSIGRKEAAFIKENHLDEYKIMTGWQTVTDDKTGEIIDMDTNFFVYTDNVAPYFKENIFYNCELNDAFSGYLLHKRATKQENAQNLLKWHEAGLPDVLYLEPAIELVFSKEELKNVRYSLVYFDKTGCLWKGACLNRLRVHIYVRSDLLEEMGLEEIPEPPMNEKNAK